MKTLCIVSTGFCLSLSVMAATAAAPTFDGLDRNADDYISKEEAKAYKDMHKNWSKVDTNKDGRVNIDEFTRFESRGRFTPPEESGISEPGAAPL